MQSACYVQNLNIRQKKLVSCLDLEVANPFTACFLKSMVSLPVNFVFNIENNLNKEYNWLSKTTMRRTFPLKKISLLQRTQLCTKQWVMSSELSYIKSYYLLHITSPARYSCHSYAISNDTPCKIRVIDLRDFRFVRFVFSPKYSAPPLRVNIKE